MAFCGKCGIQINDDDRFCRSCGQPVGSDEEKVQDNAVTSKPFRKLWLIMLVAVTAALLVTLLVLSQTLFKVSEVNKSPRAAVYNYLQAIDTSDIELFTRCVEAGTEKANLNRQLLDEQKIITLGSTSPKDELRAQMEQVSKSFANKYGKDWLDTLQIAEPDSINGEQAAVTITIGNINTTIPTVKQGRKGWFLVSNDYSALLPEVFALLDLPPTQDSVFVNTQSPGKTDYISTLQRGKVTGLEYGLGSKVEDIAKTWGEPTHKGEYNSSYLFMQYDNKRLLFLYSGWDRSVAAISFMDGFNAFGVEIGKELSQLERMLGKPTNIGSISKDDEFAAPEDGYMGYYEYVAGRYKLKFYHNNANVTGAYLLIIPPDAAASSTDQKNTATQPQTQSTREETWFPYQDNNNRCYLNLKDNGNGNANVLMARIGIQHQTPVGGTSDVRETLDLYAGEIKQTIIKYFQAMTIDDIRKPDAKEIAKTELTTKINQLLKSGTGINADIVVRIDFYEWVYQ